MKRDSHLYSIVTCPECGHAKAEPDTGGEGRLIYQCTACRVLLRPKQGDCCVLCSYGDRTCRASDPEALPA